MSAAGAVRLDGWAGRPGGDGAFQPGAPLLARRAAPRAARRHRRLRSIPPPCRCSSAATPGSSASASRRPRGACSFSFPERRRSSRDRLRRRLAALGCGTVADGLWIAPAALEDELAATAREIAGEAEVVSRRRRSARRSGRRPGAAGATCRRCGGRTSRSCPASAMVASRRRRGGLRRVDARARRVRASSSYRDPGLPAAELPRRLAGCRLGSALRPAARRTGAACDRHAAALAGPDRGVWHACR
ncbi:hypothetical protein ACRAWC_20350 [Leifsonia sp. L25]|uniref:hypothetical protein n=1 Tax=Leifsonia sp. L25 TaxID=3423957 RepID=UPI003D691EB8